MQFNEGGHAVSNVTRINQENVKATLEKLQSDILDELGVEVGSSARVLGSTGKRHPGDSSGDIDVAISMDAIKRKLNLHDESQIIEKIKDVVREVTPDISDNTKAGMIHFSYPIVNVDKKQKNEKVQVDFMLVMDDDLDYVDFGYWSPAQWESKYKGAFRTIALMMIAAEGKKKVLESRPDPKTGEDIPVTWERMILDPRKGLFNATQTNLSPKTDKPSKTNRTLNRKLITNKPDEVVKLLLGKEANIKDTQSFEGIIDFMNSEKFIHKKNKDAIINRIAEELMKQMKLSSDEVKEVLQIESTDFNNVLVEAAKGVDASKGVSHLEFIDDMIFNLGAEGLELSIDTLEKTLGDIKKEGNINQDIHKSVKIDGAPSLYFGKTPEGKFFVATKTIHNKNNQKLGYSLNDINQKWEGEIAHILSNAFKLLKNTVKDKGIVLNGDLLFSDRSQKKMRNIDGTEYLTFQPNTILYAMPKDPKSEIYKKASKAFLGIAIHSAFTGTTDKEGRLGLNRLPTSDIIKLTEAIDNPNVYAMHPFIPHVDVQDALSTNKEELEGLLESLSEEAAQIDPDFDDAWKTGSNPILKKIKTEMQKFLKSEALKSKENIYSEGDIDKFVGKFKNNLSKYLYELTKGQAETLQTASGKSRKLREAEELKDWVDNSDDTFDVFIKSYFYLYNIKVLLLNTFNKVKTELGKTFVVDKKNDKLIATNPEGYVLLNGPNMVKIVDRAEFSKNNLLYSPFGDSKTTQAPKPEKEKTITDEILEDVIDKLSAMESIYGGFTDEDMIESAEKYGSMDAIYVGRFQPPTIAHIKNILDLSKLFRKVYVLISDSSNKTKKYLSKNPLTAEERIDIMKSDPKLSNLKNVVMRGGATNMVFGLPHPDAQRDLKKLFKVPSDRDIVLSIGKEDDRYFAMKDRGNMFVVNDGEFPSDEKPVGLYGIELQKFPGVKEKVSATTARNAIMNGEDEKAKEVMGGSDDKLDEIIPILRERIQSLNEEDYINIEGFDVDKEIVKSIQEEYCIDQLTAMDMIFDILKSGD